MRPRQAALFGTLLPKLALDLSKPAPADLGTLFGGADDVRLESGFGGGEHLVAEAERNPGTGFIGIEPFVNGMAKSLRSTSAISPTSGCITATQPTYWPGCLVHRLPASI